MIADFRTIFKNSQFLKLWTSQLLSQVTVNVMNFILLAHLFSKTGSAIATSLLWIAYALPSVFFGPIGAVSVDLVSRRKLLMITNLLQALAVLGYVFVYESSYYLAYGLVLIYSFLNQFYLPAETATVPSLVEKEDLPHANSLFIITQQGAIILGFGMAGSLLALLGFDGTLILCSVFLFLAFISVTFLPEIKARIEMPKTVEEMITSFYTSIMEGYNFIKSHREVLFPLLLLIGVQVGVAIIVIALPVLAKEVFNVPLNVIGTILVVPAGFGALIGSIYISKILKTGTRKRKVIEISLLLASISLIILGLIVPFIPAYLKILLGIMLTVILGYAFIGINIPTVTFLQEVTPHELRGRVFGNMWFVVTILTIFPVLFSGVITELFGVKTLITILAAGCFSIFIYSKKWKYIHQS